MKIKITIGADKKDVDKFRALQKTYKDKGCDQSVIFREMMECYEKIKGGF